MQKEKYNKAMETSSSVGDFLSCFDSGCSRCSLSDHDNQVVIARGDPKAKIMLIGEAPGAKEDQCGKPFTGPAGQLLDRIFDAIGMKTERDLFITNIVFCRPVAPWNSKKQNYTPKQEQIVRCMPFTDRLIELVDPDILIACGGPAMKNLMDDQSMRVTQWEGKWLTHRTDRKLFCMLHPAAILHKAAWPDEQRQMKTKVWNYMQEFRDEWKRKATQNNRKSHLEGTQESQLQLHFQ